MTDSLSGHTAAQNTLGADGLRDGDALSTATLTNALQGLHGNGILRLEDGAYGSTRNATNSQPGAMVRASAHTLTVTGGYVALDGVLYEFANGPGGSATLVLGDATDGNGGVQLTSTSEEALYVVYVASAGGEAKVHYEGGGPVNAANGLYPVAPSAYLTDYNTGVAQSNMKTIVLAIVRVRGGGTGNHSVDIQEINDKRIFLPPSVRYMAPLSLGALASNRVSDGGTEGINTIAHLNALQTDTGDLAYTDSITALWPSHPRYNASADVQVPATSGQPGFGHGPSRGVDLGTNHVRNNLYFAGRNNEATGHYSVRLDGQGVDATTTELTGGQTYTLTADGDAFLMLSVASGQEIILNPETDGTNYKFPEGHVIEVCNKGVAGKGNIRFDQPELNAVLNPGQRATFIYEGSKWMSCNYPIAGGGVTDGDKGDITVSSSGATWTIDNDAVTYAKIQDVSQTNVLLGRDSTGAGIIEEIDATAARAILNVADGATANAGTVTSIATTAPITGGTITGTGTIGISAATTSAAGSMSGADKTKLDGIAAGATVYTDLMAVGAIEAAASITLDPSATFTANRSVVEDVVANGLPISPTALELMEDQRGKVLVNSLAGITTIGLPDPGASLLGDTYVILNTHSGAVTIDRGGGLHGTPQNLNGAATNGSLPAHEAVTLIYTGVTGWYGIGL